jgi:ribonucleoside-diphosphate reductase alpha chain
MLNDWHPDILAFVTAKADLSRLQRANISVGISDAFMQAVKDDADWELTFPDTKAPQYNRLWDGDMARWKALGLPYDVYGTVRARDLFDAIAHQSWATGEPGVVFLDTYNRLSNTWYMDRVICTNPCGEQGLPGWGVCNLGSINLSRFWKDGDFDWEGLRQTVKVAVRFLDNVIDLSAPVNSQTDAMQKRTRRIGIGTMGLADLLLAASVRYGSDASIKAIDEIYSFIRDEAYIASVDLARERGVPDGFDKEQYLKGAFVETLPEEVRGRIKAHGIRNLTLLTQAPTGTTSILVGASSGTEPIFSWSYKRTDATGTHDVLHPVFEAWANGEGGVRPEYFVTAKELTPTEHVRVQAAVQKYVDSSISKTVNGPRSDEVSDVADLLMYAYDSGCKGVTYYREGSREDVLTDTSAPKVCIKDPETGACSICD